MSELYGYLRRQRARLFTSQGGECWFCGRSCRMSQPGDVLVYPNTATLEHLRKHRLVMACYECNHTRGQWSDQLRSVMSQRPRDLPVT